jgi:hypothetical protein
MYGNEKVVNDTYQNTFESTHSQSERVTAMQHFRKSGPSRPCSNSTIPFAGNRREFLKDLVTPNISACRKIDNTLLIKALFISWKRSN